MESNQNYSSLLCRLRGVHKRQIQFDMGRNQGNLQKLDECMKLNIYCQLLHKKEDKVFDFEPELEEQPRETAWKPYFAKLYYRSEFRATFKWQD